MIAQHSHRENPPSSISQQCTDLVVRKEKQSSTYRALTTVPPALSEDKQAKIKKFTKEFAHRLIKKIRARAQAQKVAHKNPDGDASTSTAATTPNDPDPLAMDADPDSDDDRRTRNQNLADEDDDNVEEALGLDGELDGGYGDGGWDDDEDAVAEEDRPRGTKEARLSSSRAEDPLGDDHDHLSQA